MEVGDEKQLGIKLTGDSTVTRKYTTSDKYVATIDEDGVVHAVGAGSCKITVVAGDQGGTIDVRVTGDSYSASNDSGSGNSRGSNSSNSGRVEDVTGKTVETTGQRGARGRVDAAAGDLLPIQRDGGGHRVEHHARQPVRRGGQPRGVYRHRVGVLDGQGGDGRRRAQRYATY